jgi:hypothetical protein
VLFFVQPLGNGDVRLFGDFALGILDLHRALLSKQFRVED